MVTTFYPPYHFGGDAVYVRALSRELAARGHEVEIVHDIDAYRLRGPEPTAMPPDEPGITIHRLHSRLGLLSPLITQQTGNPGLKHGQLRRILDRDFDVVHFHNVSLVGGTGVLKLSRAPVTLYTTHEHWLICPMHILWKYGHKLCDGKSCISCCLHGRTPPQWWRYTGKIARDLQHVDAILCPSETTACRHRDEGIDRPIHVLPLFSPLTGSDEPFMPPSRPRFLFVGRITTPKGAPVLLERFAAMPQYDLDMVGEGELLDDLQAKYANQPNIRFHGQVPHDELAAMYQAATAVVFPSMSAETFGLTVVEGFAFGTPAIAHDIGGASDEVRESGAGITYDTADELDAAVHRLAGSESTRREMGRLARQAYLEYFTPQVHMDAYLQIIQQLKSSGLPAAGGVS